MIRTKTASPSRPCTTGAKSHQGSARPPFNPDATASRRPGARDGRQALARQQHSRRQAAYDPGARPKNESQWSLPTSLADPLGHDSPSLPTGKVVEPTGPFVNRGTAPAAMKVPGTVLRLLFLARRVDGWAMRAGEMDDQMKMVRHAPLMNP